MGVIHDLAAHAGGGLRGIQASQRDWSPFLAHFTRYSAMEPVRNAVRLRTSASDVLALLQAADGGSAEVAEAIAASGRLMLSSPSAENSIPPCVCLSECTLPGLLGLCERFGRFGWVFQKAVLYSLGARPCLYVGPDEYAELARRGRSPGAVDVDRRLFGLANVYAPPGHGTVQDFTHEREWRIFCELDLTATVPDLLVAPTLYVERMHSWFPGISVIPIDTLFEWGL